MQAEASGLHVPAAATSLIPRLGDAAEGAVLAVLAGWIGAVLFFSAVVAPAAFRVLADRSAAGQLVGATLPTLFVSGVLISALAFATLCWRRRSTAARRIPGLAASAVMVVSLLIGQFVIGGRITRIRAEVGGSLGALLPGDPLRQEFGRLHGLSVLALGVGVLAALFIVVLLLRGRSREELVGG